QTVRSTQGCCPQARPSCVSAAAFGSHPRNTSTERTKARGRGTEAQIGRDQNSNRPQRFGERLSNRKAEAGRRDYDAQQSSLFCRKKADRGVGRQIPFAGYLLPEGVCR